MAANRKRASRDSDRPAASVKKPKRLGLRDKAMSAPIVLIKKQSWFDKLEEDLQQEIIDLIREWDEGGDLRARYPSKRALCRFLESVESIPCKASTLSEFVASILMERHNG